jgi:hypothetical protein
MRKIAMSLAAAVIATGGTTLSASARHGGGGGHGGPVKSAGKTGVYRPSHFGHRQYGEFGGYRSGYRPGPHFDHWRYHHGWGRHYYPYSGYYGGGSCWRWTPEGRVWVCGYGRPYGYGRSYGYYHGPRYGHWGGRRPFYGHK